MKKKLKRIARGLVLILIVGMFLPTWTPGIEGENSIALLEQVEINGSRHELMIRGKDKSNPVIIFVHGGACCSEIPYVRKYQEGLEAYFTIVHYDQRGSGKSYHFFEDYSDLTTDLLVEDLLALTDYIAEELGQEKVILIGHSFGTYIGLRAASKAPEKYTAYIGIGQVSDKLESEKDNLEFCIEKAKVAGQLRDVRALEKIRVQVEAGEKDVPRSYVRKYGGAARLINETEDIAKGFLLGTEYNLLDIGRYYIGILQNQNKLMADEYNKVLPELVTKVGLPTYFIMGQYDQMTSTAIAKVYFEQLQASVSKEFIIYENTAHYPHFEEHEKFTNWMIEQFSY